MAYRLKRADASVQHAVRRIAGEQIDKAIAEIESRDADRETTVHDVRKRCKKLRGLIRLVRPAFPGYGRENTAFRDIARALSGARDRAVLVATYDALADRYDDQIERPALASIRRRLTLRLKAAEAEGGMDERLETARTALKAGRDRVASWRLQDDGYAAFAGGLAKSYKRARNALSASRSGGTAADFHDWRKRVKYHWYHARLLSPLWDAHLGMHAEAAHQLSDWLGDHHDLAVFEAEITGDPDAFGGRADVAVMAGLARTRQRELTLDCLALGGRLLAEKPKRLVDRWERYWDCWAREPGAASATVAA